MISVAITGSFASGKTFVLKYLEKLGYKIFSCDDYVADLYLDLKIQQKVVQILDIEFFDKNLIRSIYFDGLKKKNLEKFIHPLVLDGINNFKNKYSSRKLLFIEIPLLFETNFDKYFEYSICVFCSEETRLKRAKDRKRFDPLIYEKIINVQLPQEEKKKLANFCVNSDLEIENQINKILNLF